jgi:hypothetical protein
MLFHLQNDCYIGGGPALGYLASTPSPLSQAGFGHTSGVRVTAHPPDLNYTLASSGSSGSRHRTKIIIVDRRHKQATVDFLELVKADKLKRRIGEREYVPIYDWRVPEEISAEKRLHRNGHTPRHEFGPYQSSISGASRSVCSITLPTSPGFRQLVWGPRRERVLSRHDCSERHLNPHTPPT